jgi:multiple sugar transport system ATP-binding protein
VRPEAVKVLKAALKPNEMAFGDFHVELAENLGGQQMLHGRIEGQAARILVDSMDKISSKQVLPLRIDLTKAHLFDKKTGLNQRL